MNEFTKEELYDLQSWGDAYTSYDVESDVYAMHAPLLNKIQSLIDNYCEHKWIPHRIEDVILYWCIKCNASPRTTI